VWPPFSGLNNEPSKKTNMEQRVSSSQTRELLDLANIFVLPLERKRLLA
jgi:hypothetical protein